MFDLQIPKAVIFDWDNTLVDSWPLIENAFNTTLTSMGKKPWDITKIKSNTHNSMREHFPRLFGSRSEQASKLYQSVYKENNLQKIKFLPGAIQLINTLHQRGIILIIISNKLGNNLRAEAEKLQINDKFFAIIGSMDAAYDKPSNAPVELALAGSDLDPKKDLIWFIGDTIVDLWCAHNSECQPVLYGSSMSIDRNFLEECKKNPQKPLLHFNSHQEIIEYIAKW